MPVCCRWYNAAWWRKSPGSVRFPSPPAKAIGVREIQAHLVGECSLEEAIAAIQLATRQYARRQEKWFRRETGFPLLGQVTDTMPELGRNGGSRAGARFPSSWRAEPRAKNAFANALSFALLSFIPRCPHASCPIPSPFTSACPVVPMMCSLVADLLAQTGKLAADLLKRKHCAIVTDSNVGPLYAQKLQDSLAEHKIKATLITVPAGEPSKSMTVVEDVCRQMLRAGLDRKSFLIALGGGVIGDLAGFAASIFLRGIPFIQIPTTMLAQVDSSVGGKTGVNTAEGKNLLGTFAQPSLVIADVDTLRTLPQREYKEGFAEIIKHAAIRDADMFEAILALADGKGSHTELIRRNVAIKARIVEQDEHETSGLRALLNFGHTIGHAIEASAGYGEMLHGEAISLGMVAAARLSTQVSGLTPAAAAKIVSTMSRFDLPTRLPDDMPAERILEHMKHDKKFSEGKIRFVLLRTMGDAYVSSDVTEAHIVSAIKGLRF